MVVLQLCWAVSALCKYTHRDMVEMNFEVDPQKSCIKIGDRSSTTFTCQTRSSNQNYPEIGFKLTGEKRWGEDLVPGYITGSVMSCIKNA